MSCAACALQRGGHGTTLASLDGMFPIFRPLHRHHYVQRWSLGGSFHSRSYSIRSALGSFADEHSLSGPITLHAPSQLAQNNSVDLAQGSCRCGLEFHLPGAGGPFPLNSPSSSTVERNLRPLPAPDVTEPCNHHSPLYFVATEVDRSRTMQNRRTDVVFGPVGSF